MTDTFRLKVSVMFFGAVFGIGLFFAYSFLPLSVPGFHNSPDENANAFFSRVMAETGQLHWAEPLNLILDNRVHPRSVKAVGGLLLPGGFLGLPLLYGTMAKAIGTGAIPFLTPIFSLLGALAWGALIRRKFGTVTGVFAAILLATCPAWWYWSSRTLMPNVLSVSLLIMAAYFLYGAPFLSEIEKRGLGGLHFLRHADNALAGILLGLSLTVRLDALYWVAIIAVVSAAFLRRRLPWRRLAVCAIFAAMTMAPTALLNQSLYGHFIATGYGDVVATVGDGGNGGMGARILGQLRPFLFPLGFAPRVAWSNFVSFGLRLFWWWWLPVIAAVPYLMRERKRAPCPRETRRLVAIAVWAGLAVSCWLVLFYGSWRVYDNPDPDAVTIGASYTRYWLPIFVFATLPLAAGLARAFAVWRRRRATVALSASVCAALMAVSAWTVFGAPQEGLNAVRDNLARYRSETASVLAHTEPDAVIIVDRADKYLFPDRAVIYPLRDEGTYGLLPIAVANRPTYYFGISLPQKDLGWLRTVKLPPLGLTVEPVVGLGENSLYVFRQLEKPPSDGGDSSPETL